MPPIANDFTALALQPRAAALVLLVLAAAAFDSRTHRLPNVLTGSGAVAGLALAAASVGAGPSFQAALAGCAVGLAFLLPLYALHATGAGDVKLMAAVGAFVGPFDAMWTVLFTFLAGGLLALAWLAWQRSVPRFAGAIGSMRRIPYAPAVCAGTFACLWLRHPFSS